MFNDMDQRQCPMLLLPIVWLHLEKKDCMERVSLELLRLELLVGGEVRATGGRGLKATGGRGGLRSVAGLPIRKRDHTP